MPISVAARSKAWVYGRSLAGIGGSNRPRDMDVCCECCMLSGRGLCDGPITRTEKSYRLWCVVLCDLETSRMRRPWPALGRSVTGGIWMSQRSIAGLGLLAEWYVVLRGLSKKTGVTVEKDFMGPWFMSRAYSSALIMTLGPWQCSRCSDQARAGIPVGSKTFSFSKHPYFLWGQHSIPFHGYFTSVHSTTCLHCIHRHLTRVIWRQNESVQVNDQSM